MLAVTEVVSASRTLKIAPETISALRRQFRKCESLLQSTYVKPREIQSNALANGVIAEFISEF
jgi:hypothetical protein